MIFTYNTGDVFVFGMLLLAIIGLMLMMGYAAFRVAVRKISEAFARAFQFNMLKEREREDKPSYETVAEGAARSPARKS